LLAAGLYLVATRAIPAPPFRKALRRDRAYAANLSNIFHNEGLCFAASIPENVASDADSTSRLELFEDEEPLGPAHALHSDIREVGAGRYSHWGPWLYFSTSDGTDPGLMAVATRS